MYKRQDDDLVRLRAQSAAMQKKAQEEQGAKETGKRASRMSLYGAVLQLSLIHILLGQVYEGMDVVDAIGQTAVDENQKPREDITINSVSITQYE